MAFFPFQTILELLKTNISTHFLRQPPVQKQIFNTNIHFFGEYFLFPNLNPWAFPCENVWYKIIARKCFYKKMYLTSTSFLQTELKQAQAFLESAAQSNLPQVGIFASLEHWCACIPLFPSSADQDPLWCALQWCQLCCGSPTSWCPAQELLVHKRREPAGAVRAAMVGDAGGGAGVHEEQRAGQPRHRELQTLGGCPVHPVDCYGGVAKANVAKPPHHPCPGQSY